MEEVTKIYIELEKIQDSFGNLFVAIVIIISLALHFLYKYLSSYIYNSTHHQFAEKLENLKNDLNNNLGKSLLEKYGELSKELEVVKNDLNNNLGKSLLEKYGELSKELEVVKNDLNNNLGKSLLEKYGELSKELEVVKNDLNNNLGKSLLEKYGEVNKEIVFIKAEISNSHKKKLDYHNEKIEAIKSVYNLVIKFSKMLTDPHHGAVNHWDSDELRDRVAKITTTNNDLRTSILYLKLYIDDSELFEQIYNIQKLFVNNIYTPTKKYLLEIRKLNSEYRSCKTDAEMEAHIQKRSQKDEEYNKILMEFLETSLDQRNEFYNYFRNYYESLYKMEESPD